VDGNDGTASLRALRIKDSAVGQEYSIAACGFL